MYPLFNFFKFKKSIWLIKHSNNCKRKLKDYSKIIVIKIDFHKIKDLNHKTRIISTIDPIGFRKLPVISFNYIQDSPQSKKMESQQLLRSHYLLYLVQYLWKHLQTRRRTPKRRILYNNTIILKDKAKLHQ